MKKVYIHISTNAKDKLHVSNFNVFKRACVCISKYKLDLFVIGESHMAQIDKLAYQEIIVGTPLCSSDSILDLDNDSEIASCITKQNEGVKVNFSVRVIRFDEKVLKEFASSNLYFEFSKYAVTALRVNNKDNTLETMHSYPEYDKIILSKSVFNFIV